MRRTRDPGLALPTERGTAHGLAYALWLAARPTGAGAVILHGAGSVKESHHDFARVLQAAGLAALVFDQRGHGESTGPMDGHVLDDIAAMATLLRDRLGSPEAPIALRGSSMGGYFALLAAPRVSAGAVVAICPASADGLRRGLANQAFPFDVDAPSLDALLAAHDTTDAAAALDAAALILHAEGDEIVPIEHSQALAARLRHPASRFIAVPGGHHRSIQHDAELQAVSVKFIASALSA